MISFGTIPCANDVWCDNEVEIGYEAITDIDDMAYNERLCESCLDSYYWLQGIGGIDE